MSLLRGNAMILRGAEVFMSRRELEKKHSIVEFLQPGNEIHALWVTGQITFDEKENHLRNIKSLILPNPNSKSLQNYQYSMKRTSDKLAEQIIAITQTALDYKIDVRWYKDFVGASLIICNPDRLEAWAQIEICLPSVSRAEHQVIRLSRRYYEDSFLSVWNAYQEMWKNSEIPNL